MKLRISVAYLGMPLVIGVLLCVLAAAQSKAKRPLSKSLSRLAWMSAFSILLQILA